MEVQQAISENLIEVFKTHKGAVYQSDDEQCLYLIFGGKTARYSFSCFSRLKKQIVSYNIEQLLTRSALLPDIEIVTLAACEHCYVLSITDLIALKDILEGAFAMFQLNHMIKDCLQRYIA
ncbi:hypothetical protein GS399_08110 [Pedobacter sp. HMF7647]|uniref:Uncharacterized protein n=1 Tax=Hufsiella arboris TaxID=2695275 RepID=A0A7K1Y8N0_9SPHI|nr:hypothetical protein [Hufsiella arboris]MXV50936.1 hypothetical protein [Hufsiella arboris]